MATFRLADESVSKQNYYEQAVLFSESAAMALGALELAINAIEINHPEHPYLFDLKQYLVNAREIAKQANAKIQEKS
jgi:hypothetical protein